MENSRPTVFIVDDDKAVRRSLQILVETVDLPVKVYGSAKDFLHDYHPSWPGCLVLDVRMSEMNGLRLQSTLLTRNISIPIIFLSGYGDIPMAVKAVKLGAVDFIRKPFREQELLDCIEKAIKLDMHKRKRRAEERSIEERIQTLSPREREVFGLLITGKPNKEIGHDLGISQKTVDFHRVNILEKMKANSVIEIVVMMKVGSHEWKTVTSNDDIFPGSNPLSSFEAHALV